MPAARSRPRSTAPDHKCHAAPRPPLPRAARKRGRAEATEEATVGPAEARSADPPARDSRGRIG
eukprot:8548911-Alexandrium_andersonii.AAC.1